MTASVRLRLRDLRDVLESAAEKIRSLYNTCIPVHRKQDRTPITRADMEANRILRQGLSRLLPKAGWLSEESADNPKRLQCEWLWIVDPLDGTEEFARNIPEFAISVGLVYQDQVVAAGVLNPITNEGGVGSREGDPEFWGLRPKASLSRNLAEAVVCVSRSEVENGRVNPYLSCVGATHPVGSVAYKLLRVAAGIEDLTFSVEPKSEWDICGGIGLITCVGKVCRRLDGVALRFNQPNTRICSGSVAGEKHLVSEFLQAYLRTLRS